MSIYALKPRFQDLLRPLVRRLAALGVTANQVTLLAAILSVALGLLLFARMALNAIDGMLAREFGQKSALGAYLNELCDVVSDAFLYLPFAFLPHFSPAWVGTCPDLDGS